MRAASLPLHRNSINNFIRFIFMFSNYEKYILENVKYQEHKQLLCPSNVSYKSNDLLAILPFYIMKAKEVSTISAIRPPLITGKFQKYKFNSLCRCNCKQEGKVVIYRLIRLSFHNSYHDAINIYPEMFFSDSIVCFTYFLKQYTF